MTGGLAGPGKQALLGVKIWEEQINKKGGLLGRPVKIIAYDDQTNASTVPGIYTKLIDVDKVDLILGPYATNMIAPAMPVVMQKGKTIVGAVRSRGEQRVQLPEIFRDDPDRPEHQAVLHRRLLRGRRARTRSETVALVAADAEFANNACEGARDKCEEAQHQDRLRPQISAGHDRLHADRARDPGGESGCRGDLLLSAGLGRHGARGQRDRLQAEDDRRRDGRPADHRDQDPAWAADEWLDQL